MRMSPTPTPDCSTLYDVTIIGGGPAGLAAALILGRSRRRVLLLDAGAPRNSRAKAVHGMITRDGTPPAEIRRLAHEQLAAYPLVDRAENWVERVTGERDAFELDLRGGTRVRTRRIVLALGMVDVLPELPGYEELWGRAIFQCPYCHAWEQQDKPFGFLAPGPEALDFALFLKGWTSDIIAFTEGRFEVPAEKREQLEAAGVRIEERPILRLILSAEGDRLDALELSDGSRVSREVLFARPPQHQTALVSSLGLALDENGYVQVDARQATSIPGIYAAGDLTTMMQNATMAAAAGNLAAAMVNHDLAFSAPVLAGQA